MPHTRPTPRRLCTIGAVTVTEEVEAGACSAQGQSDLARWAGRAGELPLTLPPASITRSSLALASPPTRPGPAALFSTPFSAISEEFSPGFSWAAD
jgi:hypothetical protein